MATDNKTFLDDRESLQALVDKLPSAQRDEYMGMKSLALESAFPGRKFVVYTLRSGVPQDTDILTLGDLTLSPHTGPEVTATLRSAGAPWVISTTPTRVPTRALYLHVPQKFELKWKGKPGPRGTNFAAHYAVLIKSLSQPRLLLDNEPQCVRFNTFKEMFPNINIGY